MPCKGDELCCEDSTKPHEFDNSPKTNDSNGFSSDNNHSFEQPLVQPQQQPKPVTNGVHDGPKQILIERRTHPSGISFESISPLPGEELKRDGITDMSNCRVFLSNYRIVIVTQNRHGVCSIPLIGVDSVEAFDETLKNLCRDARNCNELVSTKWLLLLVCGSHKLEDVFAFKFGIFCTKQRPLYLKKNASFIQNSKQYLEREFANCGFNEADWRISTANKDFKPLISRTFRICATYPQYLIVPNATTDEELTDLKRGRFFERFPTAVWRSKQGGILLRSSQPEISFFGTYHEGDIKLFDSIRKVTVNEKKRKILVIDARSYGAALANRAKGGGFEGGDGYSNAEVVFMSLPNIHSLRYSFHQLRQLLNSSIDSNGYFQALNTSQWLQYLFNLIVASQRCVDALCSEGLSVLVHCSDGWDRTTQLVSLVKLIADPYYRTFEGFERLIIRDWIEFGHKFNDRNGVTSTDTNERSPVFMQFIASF
ncbi:Phosphatidylinositol-3-phosphate phosphatase [Aphelenchoides bicaudatus]|nr:Phosphatidylinositol-3-phosphate phosphatase [Aphelenchoides bicaudatus]